MASPVIVSRVEAGDLEMIMNMANSRLREQYSLELFQHFFELMDGCFFTAKDENDVLGFILAVPLDASALRILMLVVLGSRERKGIGTSLMSSAEAFASSRMMTSLVLEVGTNNDTAIEFYKKLGFAVTGLIPDYYNDKSDAFVMKKYLPM